MWKNCVKSFMDDPQEELRLPTVRIQLIQENLWSAF